MTILTIVLVLAFLPAIIQSLFIVLILSIQWLLPLAGIWALVAAYLEPNLWLGVGGAVALMIGIACNPFFSED